MYTNLTKEEVLNNRLEDIEFRLDRIEQLLTNNFDTIPYGIQNKEEQEQELLEKLEEQDRKFMKELEEKGIK